MLALRRVRVVDFCALDLGILAEELFQKTADTVAKSESVVRR